MAAVKIYALAVLLVCSAFENASADWRSDVRVSHMQHINSIVNDTLARIRSDVSAKGNTPAAQQCYENARLALNTASYSGYSAVSTCVRNANTAGEANVCAQQVDMNVFNESLQVSRDADACLRNV